jgi:hypothetical protein
MTYSRAGFVAAFCAVVVGLAAACQQAIPQEKGDNLKIKVDSEFKVPSVWSGMYQPPAGDPYPMVVHVAKRDKNSFTATVWYPTFGNGLLSASGEVDANGNVTLTEKEILHSKADNLGQAKFVGLTDGKVWNATCEYPDGKKGKYHLKLAE